MSSPPDSRTSASTDTDGDQSGGASLGLEHSQDTLDDVLERVFDEWGVETDLALAGSVCESSTQIHSLDAHRRLTHQQVPPLWCARRVHASGQQVLVKKKPPQTSRRVVLNELRDEEQRLEAKLRELREDWKRESTAQLYRIDAPWSDPGGRSVSRSTEVWVEPLWKQIAAREEQRLRMAQQRNLVLKAQVQQQLQADKRLRKKFSRRILSFKQRSVWLETMDSSSSESSKALFDRRRYFQKLLHDTDSMLEDMAHVQTILDSKGLANDASGFRDWQVQKHLEHGLFLECIDCCALPYEKCQVNMAIRHLYGESRQLHTFSHCCEYFDSSDNFIAYQSLVRYINVHGEGHVRMREVVRNFSDDTLSVYLVITVIEPTTATGKTINAISVRWRKWIIVSSQDTQETIESGCTTSLVQSYQTVTPEVIHRNYEPFWNTNLLQGMIQVWDASLSVIQRRLESHLMEQGTRSSQ